MGRGKRRGRSCVSISQVKDGDTHPSKDRNPLVAPGLGRKCHAKIVRERARARARKQGVRARERGIRGRERREREERERERER